MRLLLRQRAVLFIALSLFCEIALAQAPGVDATPDTIPEKSVERGAVLNFRDNPSLLKLSSHEPIYFLYGDPTAKVQLSVKNQPNDDHELYFGYTQMMLWDFSTKSSPFVDVNYNPELFYRKRFGEESRLAWVDFGIFEHRSNGAQGLQSRGWNRSYLRGHTYKDVGSLRFDFYGKFFILYALDREARDARDYMGFWEAEAAISSFEVLIPHLQLYGKVNPGGRGGLRFDRGSTEIGLRAKFDRTRAWPYFYVQYFNGYNESLINYNRQTSEIRFGLLR